MSWSFPFGGDRGELSWSELVERARQPEASLEDLAQVVKRLPGLVMAHPTLAAAGESGAALRLDAEYYQAVDSLENRLRGLHSLRLAEWVRYSGVRLSGYNDPRDVENLMSHVRRDTKDLPRQEALTHLKRLHNTYPL